jgi:hypothetical protein
VGDPEFVGGSNEKNLLEIWILLIIVFSAVASPALSGCFPFFPSFGRWQEGCGGSTAEWWNDSSLTIYAPFDNPASPLALNNGTGSLSSGTWDNDASGATGLAKGGTNAMFIYFPPIR